MANRAEHRMATDQRTTFPGRIVILGFGSIGQGILPLILRHIAIEPSRICIVTAEERGHAEATELGIRFIREPLTQQNYAAILEPLLGRGDFLLNVSVEVSSLALIELCHAKGALYLDTCIEPWPGGYTDPTLSPSLRSNYALRESALALRAKFRTSGPPPVRTTVPNPARVSLFFNQPLLNLPRV